MPEWQSIRLGRLNKKRGNEQTRIKKGGLKMSVWTDEEGYEIEDNWMEWVDSCGLSPDDFED